MAREATAPAGWFKPVVIVLILWCLIGCAACVAQSGSARFRVPRPLMIFAIGAF